MTKSEYYFGLAAAAAKRSSCLTRQVGAVIVVQDAVAAVGYNGTPRGYLNCDEGGCKRCAGSKTGESLELCLCTHAEANAVAQAAARGSAVFGGAVYCNLSPCLECAKLLIAAGIAEINFQEFYVGSAAALSLASYCGVVVRKEQ